MMDEHESVTIRVLKEVDARRRYGQPCTEMRIGLDLWQEIKAKEYRHMCRDSCDPHNVIVTFMGLVVTIDRSIPPTCFEIH